MQQLSQQKRSAYRVDPGFQNKLKASHNGETLKFCFQCGACTSVCPISRYINIYRPNQMIELAKLGIRNLPQSNAFLFCSACTLCTKGCPQDVKVHEVMQALKEQATGDAEVTDFMAELFDETLEALGRQMPLPVIYSWICLRPDDGESAFHNAVMAAFDRLLKQPVPQAVPVTESKRVAIIGSGPAGLTAAWVLAEAGVAVTIFEGLPELGGMLRTGIPSYRLPKDILDLEINKIAALGVEMKTDTPVDKPFFESLVKDYSAVFIATGAYMSRRLRLEGIELNGVVDAVDFLEAYNLASKTAKVGKNVAVIGGGNVATDAAGVALRCGAESVKLFCLEDRKTMPAHEWEIEEIARDGVQLNPSWGPRAILGDGGNVTAVEFVRCKSVLDKDGRFAPVFDEKSTQTVPADTVVCAIGQAPDLSFLGEGVDTASGVIQADPYTMETNLPGVFAGGDAVSGTASLIEAVSAGKTAAQSIMLYMGVDK